MISVTLKNRNALFAGLSLFLCFCGLSAAKPISACIPQQNWSALTHFGICAVSFVLAAMLLKMGVKDGPSFFMRIRLNVTAPEVIYFMVWGSLACACAGFLLDFLAYHAFSSNWLAELYHSSIYQIAGNSFHVVLLFAIILPVFLGIYVYDALFAVQESYCGTAICILLSGICYALLPHIGGNLLGAFLTGCFCAYMTYEFDCVWPAVFVQIITNLYRCFLLWIATTYNAFGAWKYFPSLSGIFLLLSLYMTCRSLSILLENQRIEHWKRTENFKDVRSLLFNIGTAAFVLAVVAKNVLKLV